MPHHPDRRLRDAGGAPDPLRGSLADFYAVGGPHLIERTAPIVPWIEARAREHLMPYGRAVSGAVGPEVRAEAETQTVIRQGINLATQDYLSLSSYPLVRDAAARAIHDYGVHSGGSSVLQGRSDASRALERELGEHLGYEHVTLTSSGWGAAYAVVTALVRATDHVVMDRLAHASLQAGARAATANVRAVKHNDVEAVRAVLAEIRATDAAHGILVITEGLFSMDSDSPDLRALQAVCREYGAVLLVDVAHDLGALGPHGTGHLGREGLLGQVDLVMGAFSKTFASNGGFVATSSAGVRAFTEAYGGPHTFSNALSPVQVAVVREALRVVRSAEGDGRRAALLSNVTRLRSELARYGLTVLGDPSAVVPVQVGHTPTARVASRGALQRGVFVNLVEYPAVGLRGARLRLQVQADHTLPQMLDAARLIAEAVAEAKTTVERIDAERAARATEAP